MNPRASPMASWHCDGCPSLQRLLVLVRHHSHEATRHRGPVRQHMTCAATAAEPNVPFNQPVELPAIDVLCERAHFEKRRMLLAKRAGIVEDVRDATTHAGGEVSPDSAKHDDDTAGHILARMVADAFDHSG